MLVLHAHVLLRRMAAQRPHIHTRAAAAAPGCAAPHVQEAASDGANGWRSKDCALALVMAVTVRGKTGERGATSTSRLIDVGDFFNTQVGARGFLWCV